MTYPEAIQYLYGLRLFGAALGLANTRRLAAAVGNPQHGLKFVHVAGTNGKGSTCAFIESIYRAGGYRVGLFTSPHLVRFRERIQVDRQMITQRETIQRVRELREVLGQEPWDPHPTFFEVVTVMALRHFSARQCDVVVWETGLGGRLDATNIVSPLVSVITNVQLDHQKWLGRTRTRIASEKAGIIKPGIPVVTAESSSGPLAVLRQRARQVHAPLKEVGVHELGEHGLSKVSLGLRGPHQRINAALAVAAVTAASADFTITRKAMADGLRKVSWPGRFQIVRRSNGGQVLLDGAHNPPAARALKEAVGLYFPKTPPALILAIFKDKDWRAICRILVPVSSRVIVTEARSRRALGRSELARFCRSLGARIPVEESASCGEALRRAQNERLTLVTGSLYLVGEALQALQAPGEGANEMALNEWVAGRSDR